MSDLRLSDDTRRAAAFRQIFEATFDDLTRFVARRIDAHACDDVVSETFLIAWRRFADLPTELEHARPWLFATARKVLANSYRSQKRARSLQERVMHQPDAPADDPAAHAIRVDYARAFDRLSAKDQEVLQLVAWEGLTDAQAALVLDISVAAFSARLSRARKRLKKHLHHPADAKDQS